MEENTMIALASEYIDAHREEMLDLWETLVSTESGNSDKEGVDRVCEILRQELECSGAQTTVVEMEKRGNFLRAEFCPRNHTESTEDAPSVIRSRSAENVPLAMPEQRAAGKSENGTARPGGILLIGHMDTVFAKGTIAKNPFRIEDGKAYGPGILDMKAGLVMTVFILRALKACGYEKRPIRVVFAGDEENGHRESTAQEEIRRACAGCSAAFNFETGFLDDGLVIGRKGSCRVTVDVEGVASHAGNDPERGRSAILEMAHKVIEIQKLNDYEHGLFVNVGVINGGTVANAVPGNCQIQIDIRYEDKNRLENTLDEIRRIAEEIHVPDTKAAVTMTRPSEVMPPSEANKTLFEHVKRAAKRIGYGDVTTKTVGGWSDSCLAAACGVPVVCAMGVKGANNHSMEEYAVVDTLFARTKLALASIITL